jgi:hypothetical protein
MCGIGTKIETIGIYFVELELKLKQLEFIL